MPKPTQINNWPAPTELQSGIDKKTENNRILFRFNDLQLSAQQKLAALLKNHSNCRSVQRLTPVQIFHALRVTNPIVIQNYYNNFCYGQLPRFVETELSRIVYYLHCRKPKPEVVASLKKDLATPNSRFVSQPISIGDFTNIDLSRITLSGNITRGTASEFKT